jgi:hypothetical protein
VRAVLIIGVSIHILAGVFWAGTTFVLARTNGQGAERLFRPQMGAALITIAAGAYLWYLLGPSQWLLILGVLAALIAAAIQGALGGRALRHLDKGAITEPMARAQVALAHRIASGLLAFTIFTMAVSRYV